MKLDEKLNYLNMKEILRICQDHGIPYKILVEKKDGRLVASKDKDRKGVILSRLRKYLKTGKVGGPTIYKSKVCSDARLTSPTSKSKIHYSQYTRDNKELLSLMHSLTDGKFKNGSIAREVLRDFWTAGKAPSVKEFAKAWMTTFQKGSGGHDEWAYLSDLADGKASKNWKAKRIAIAKQALAEIAARKKKSPSLKPDLKWGKN